MALGKGNLKNKLGTGSWLVTVAGYPMEARKPYARMSIRQRSLRADYSRRSAYSIGEGNLRKPELAEVSKLAAYGREKELRVIVYESRV
jgi:hypothetical protein